ncbi:hypothetical protein NC653_028612 [Populus alba x Populus x berolinensis]|uniref:Uncharacterized protein n=1 Tax=Populus alba x Populus x berolinensis TaxID=444605 RepID=A0AAD6Q2G3_9ROSI|nr:hypothetical protein NC653_028612 [Populus alba x Populus x berolinensis]
MMVWLLNIFGGRLIRNRRYGWTPSKFLLWCPVYEFCSNLKQMLP